MMTETMALVKTPILLYWVILLIFLTTKSLALLKGDNQKHSPILYIISIKQNAFI